MTADDLTWSRAQRWIEQCTASISDDILNAHPWCQKQLFDKVLPARLLYIPENNDELRLFESKEFKQHIDYATLTHCWGGSSVIARSLKATLSGNLSHIPCESLDKTFKDAIIITRKLGFQYLWIDSLCIVQDDDADWIRESTILGNIYANCAINIVAADAKDGSIGCFFHRTATPDYGFCVRDDLSDAESKQLWTCVTQRPEYGSMFEFEVSWRAW
jgi:hypothetical protein